MSEQELAPTLSQAKLLRLVMDSIAYRVRLWATLVLSFALFAWALMAPSDWRIMTLRLLGAVAFTCIVHVPMWHRDKGEAK